MKVFKNSKGGWDWLKILIPVLTIVVIPLVGLIYNNMALAIDKKADKDTTTMSITILNETVKQKVDNNTLLLLLQQQKQRQEFIQEQVQEQKVIDKETLETLQNLNIQMKLIEQKLK